MESSVAETTNNHADQGDKQEADQGDKREADQSDKREADQGDKREADQDDKREETKENCAGQLPVLHSYVSFSEVLHLVQSGENIPGLQKLNITATKGTPTPSQMARKPKPWEIIP